MKKRLIFFAIVLATLPTLLRGNALVEGRVSYFRPTSSILRQIYGDAWVAGEIEANGSLGCCFPWLQCLNLFAGVGYTSASGRSIGERDPTEIWIVPITLGLKYIQPITCGLSTYLGAGPRYFIAHTHDHSPFVKPHITETGLGGMIEGGFLYRFSNCLTLDLFASYSFKQLCHKAEPPLVGHCVDVGGLNVGAGIGFCF